jgi:ParB/RepB/Spo0J family partition protein
MPMTEAAIRNDRNLGLPLTPIKQIYRDDEFNSRTWFSPSTCISLANDIGIRGLQQPVIVRGLRPCDAQGLPGEAGLIAQGFTVKLIAGFRRLTCYTILKADVIPTIVKDAYISDFESRDINAIENLHRKDLSLWEEARAIKHYWTSGWQDQEIADRVNQSVGWVRTRIMLLEMPTEIQEMAGTGHILQVDIRSLYKYRHERENLLKSAAKLRDLRKAGMTRNITRLIEKKDKPDTKKARKRSEIFELMQLIRNLSKDANKNQVIVVGNLLSDQGNSIITRVLGWASGEVSSGELYQAVQAFAEILDIEFDPSQYTDQEVPL